MIQKLIDIPMPRETAEPACLTAEQIGRLAQTCERADQPIWVHDLEARCLYRNLPAVRGQEHREALMVFDIIDHRDQAVGYLATVTDC